MSMKIQGIYNNTYNNYHKNNISSGYRINRAADDAAGLAISEKLLRQINGLDVGSSNIKDGIGVLNIADGGLDGMAENLQRIRELSVKAKNGTYSESDRGMIQEEISQLLQGVEDYAKNTQFNEMQLLDGSKADINIASNPEGGGMSIKMVNGTLDGLGIKDYDVTSGNFDMSRIDKALERVNSARSSIGAQTNRLEHSYNYNTYSSINQTASYSQIKDLDMPKAISQQKQDDLMKQYQNMMLRKRIDEKKSYMARMFM